MTVRVFFKELPRPRTQKTTLPGFIAVGLHNVRDRKPLETLSPSSSRKRVPDSDVQLTRALPSDVGRPRTGTRMQWKIK